MTEKAKVVNYTPEMTAKMVADYTATPTKETVAALATAFGKTTKSIVAKLSREGVYKKAEPTAKDGSPVVKKDAMVGMIATAIGVAEEKLDGLEKAPKVALKLVYAALTAKVAAGEAAKDAEASDASAGEASETSTDSASA